MKRLVILFFCAFLTFNLYSQYNLSENYISMSDKEGHQKSFLFKKLKIYPLLGGTAYQKEHENLGNYTNLEDALKNKKVEIMETGNTTLVDTSRTNDARNNDIQINPTQNNNSNQMVQQRNNIDISQNTNNISNTRPGDQVNKLFIKNLSQDTIYLMAGEVIKGGKQDRILAQDMIIPPNTNVVDISVFCVERNRWHYKSSNPSSFDSYYSVGANSLRKSVSKSQNQSKVWETVANLTKKNEASTSTGTYTALTASPKYKKNVEEYFNYFNEELQKMNNCIGFVGVSGKKIIGCDIFATPDLFSKQRKQLLNAYITEAITSGDAITVKDDAVKTYLEEFLKDESSQDAVIDKRGVQFRHNKRKLHITTY